MAREEYGYRSLQETNKLAEKKGLLVCVGLNSRHSSGRLETARATSSSPGTGATAR